MLALPSALQELGNFVQFISYSVKTVKGKVLKLPVDPSSGYPSNLMDPANWMDFATASACIGRNGVKGVGFVFTKNDPFFFLDIDKALKNGVWSEDALNLRAHFEGAAIETSMSGTGLHIIGKGVSPDHACKNIPLGLELYTEDRFCALTGLDAVGDASTTHTTKLQQLVPVLFPVKTQNFADWTAEYHPDWHGPLDDSALIKKMYASTDNAFNGKCTFAELWEGSDTLGQYFPHPDLPYDESSADQALANRLAFWCGNNCERMLTIMKLSGLVREKWEREDGYLKPTIIKAISQDGDVYSSKPPAPEPPTEEEVAEMKASGVEFRHGVQILAATQQVEHFEGCVYVEDLHAVLVPGGHLIKPDAFKIRYGGYSFIIDMDGKDTKNAFEAFTQSRTLTYPTAFSTVFRPKEAEGAILNIEGVTYVNTYSKADVASKKGDASIFYAHMEKLFPDPMDRAQVMSYMSAIVQYIGTKFSWCPLIQGMEGNGKSVISRCVANAVGVRYSHSPKAKQLGSNFNPWMEGNIFISVEDVIVDDKNVMESLKPMISDEYLDIEGKGTNSGTREVCANFIMNSNWKDAIQLVPTGRRYAIYYTPQQNAGDLKRDGMDGKYMPDLWDWLKDGGFAIVTHELENFIIPDELNPTIGLHRCPDTSSTSEALKESLGNHEQEIMEAAESELLGFKGGWVSSYHLTQLFDNKRMILSPRKRTSVLESAGYIRHPGLAKGRTNGTVGIDGGTKPRLYVTRNHTSIGIKSAKTITEMYEKAQNNLDNGTVTS